MRKLTYKNVFLKYEKSFSHTLSRKAYSVYKSARLKTSNCVPLKDKERFLFDDTHFDNDVSSEIPKGYDYNLNQEAEGFVNLKYIDFFDYLPKENIDSFKKKLRHFVLSNKKYRFASFRTEEDDDRISNMGRYIDRKAFSNLYTIEFSNNDYLSNNAPQLSVAIRNLSSSFIVIKYRAFISNAFKNDLEGIYKKTYKPFSDVCREFNTPWYKPWKFGRSMYTGDNAREAEVYSKISELKWAIYCELSRYFKVYFTDNLMFPPTFETYSTNIQYSSDSVKNGFWRSIGLDYCPDYSPQYRAFVNWARDISDNEGMKLQAVCGIEKDKKGYYPELIEHNLSDIYSVYLVASTIRRIAERDIALCNKKISRAIRSGKTSRLLKVRSSVERKLYYSYRFLSEFSGETLEKNDVKSFVNTSLKAGSISEQTMNGIASSVSKTKQQIDALLYLLNNAAEIESSKSIMTLQWVMAVITILSLFVAIITLLDLKLNFNSIRQIVFRLLNMAKTI